MKNQSISLLTILILILCTIVGCSLADKPNTNKSSKVKSDVDPKNKNIKVYGIKIIPRLKTTIVDMTQDCPPPIPPPHCLPMDSNSAVLDLSLCLACEGNSGNIYNPIIGFSFEDFPELKETNPLTGLLPQILTCEETAGGISRLKSSYNFVFDSSIGYSPNQKIKIRVEAFPSPRSNTASIDTTFVFPICNM